MNEVLDQVISIKERLARVEAVGPTRRSPLVVRAPSYSRRCSPFPQASALRRAPLSLGTQTPQSVQTLFYMAEAMAITEAAALPTPMASTRERRRKQ